MCVSLLSYPVAGFPSPEDLRYLRAVPPARETPRRVYPPRGSALGTRKELNFHRALLDHLWHRGSLPASCPGLWNQTLSARRCSGALEPRRECRTDCERSNNDVGEQRVRPLTMLILKRASVSRPSGEWNEDDFDVLADGAVVGRIFKANASPVGSSWMWIKPAVRSRGYQARLVSFSIACRTSLSRRFPVKHHSAACFRAILPGPDR
jgi:hypothetical protein